MFAEKKQGFEGQGDQQKIQSRLKTSISTFRIPHKKKGLVGGSLDILNLALSKKTFWADFPHSPLRSPPPSKSAFFVARRL